MKSFPVPLQTHLESGTTTLAWCWRLTRNDGAVFGFTDHDRPLTFDGTTFETVDYSSRQRPRIYQRQADGMG